jgi:tetratricopeptide (TPR) repeat protein
MLRWASIFLVGLSLGVSCLGQNSGDAEQPDNGPGQSHQRTNPDRDREAGDSSSANTRIDITPPPDDAKNHPESASAVANAEDVSPDNAGDVQEFHPWNPHKAMKDIEVGDFYLNLKNYRAALSRYQEALLYKPNDAIANFRIGECFEKMDQPSQAVIHYQQYLKILPHGPLSKDAEKSVAKLEKLQDAESKPDKH